MRMKWFSYLNCKFFRFACGVKLIFPCHSSYVQNCNIHSNTKNRHLHIPKISKTQSIKQLQVYPNHSPSLSLISIHRFFIAQYVFAFLFGQESFFTILLGWVFQCIFATLSNPFVTKVHSMKVLIKVRLFTTVIIWIYTKFHIVLFVSSSKAIFHFYFW